MLRTRRRIGLLNLGGGRRVAHLSSGLCTVGRHAPFDADFKTLLIGSSIALGVQ